MPRYRLITNQDLNDTDLANIKGIPTSGTYIGGPVSGAIDGNFASFDGTGGKKLKDSGNKASDFVTGTPWTSEGYYVGDGSAFAPALGINDNYVTDSEKVVIGNTSGTNTGDNAANTQYSGLATSKQDVLVSGSNIKTVNTESLLGSGDITITGGDIIQSQVFS